MIHATIPAEQVDTAVGKLSERRKQLLDWLQLEETSRDGAHGWKSEVLRGRLQEVEWALSLLGHPGAPQTAETRHS